MKMLIVSNAPLIQKENNWFAYSPYIKEMEIWAKYTDQVAFCCPTWKIDNGLLVSKIPFQISKIFLLSDFNVKTFSNGFKAFFQVIYNFKIILKAMFWADHIHLRCPGNVGLLACIVQVFFPHKIKTAKYAGNWDPKSKQPITYRLQKYILSNTFLTKKMQVLVYGQWKNQTKNIKPFFTATYNESDKTEISSRNFDNGIKCVFVGTLSSGKRPLFAIQIVEKLLENNCNVELSIFGEGNQRELLQNYILDKKLQKNIILKGNQNLEVVQKVYQNSHFVLLPSQSEGWPKVIAEGMFWGCIPIATSVSCVPYMLDYGNRGLLLQINLEKDVKTIQELINNEELYQKKVVNAVKWSRKYTLDYFEQEIKLLLQL
ncbi:glycosyltransferase [Flavobacterium sp.]|uniref:glycosyltransferase family 4 protein n=1 Tax=Flavobacterium sp. TaxID=239 RepID=UPI00286E614D|nr:glycosyltransferase [Flavobacterium sp.]